MERKCFKYHFLFYFCRITDLMMKIGYDAKRLFHNKTGLGNYSRAIVQNHRTYCNQDELFLFSPKIKNAPYESAFSLEKYSLVDGKDDLWRMMWMRKDIANLSLDIFHGLSNELPLKIDKLTSLKKVVTIHDLIFLKYPHYYPVIDRLIYREKFKRACLVADKIIAVSEATKQDIIDFFKVDPSKIVVVYQSCDALFVNGVDLGVSNILETDNTRPFGLFVSSITKRKNLNNVIEAMHEIRGDKPLLLVVGEGRQHKVEMQRKVVDLGLANDVKFLGHITNIELKKLYLDANFTVYPSFYEGFGIPILESLFCGTPVITSNLSAMPEAANGMGELIDPHSPIAIKNAMLKFCDNKSKVPESSILDLKEKFNPILQAQQIRSLYVDLLFN